MGVPGNVGAAGSLASPAAAVPLPGGNLQNMRDVASAIDGSSLVSSARRSIRGK